MGVDSRRWMWVESMGVASGCGCKEVYIFPYPYSSCICSFCRSIPTFCLIIVLKESMLRVAGFNPEEAPFLLSIS